MPESYKDKRRFIRRPRKSHFDLQIVGRNFKAETIDYSLGGIGATIEDSPPIKVGDHIDVRIPETSIRFEGEVVRSEKFPGSTKVGISRVGAFEGGLRDFGLADVFIGIQRAGKTGMLDVTRGSLWKVVYFDGGDIIFASSNQDDDRLGDVLLAGKRLTKEQYDKSVEAMKQTGKKQGAVLVQLGFIKPTELPGVVKGQIESIIEGLFSLRDGRFEFRETPLPRDEVITLRLSTANLIYRGVRAIRDIERIREDCPPPDSILTFSSNPLDLFQDLKLEEADKRILAFINGKTPIKDIVSLSRREEGEALKSVYALLQTRVIEVAEPGEAPDIKAEEVLESGPEEPSMELVDKISALYEQCGVVDFYKILGVRETTPAVEIKRTYYKLAKEFHPDKHYHLPSDVKYRLNAVFSYITTAYSTLTNLERRKEYDSGLTLKPEKLRSNTDKAHRKFAEGMGEFKQKRFEEALRHFAEASYLDASVSKYHFHHGLALAKLGRLKEAERAVSRALASEPFNPEYLSEAGHIYIALGMPVRAKGSFEKALKTQPGNERAKEGLLKLEASG